MLEQKLFLICSKKYKKQMESLFSKDDVYGGIKNLEKNNLSIFENIYDDKFTIEGKLESATIYALKEYKLVKYKYSSFENSFIPRFLIKSKDILIEIYFEPKN